MTEPKEIRILCIEDDRGEARLFQRRLERAGYRVELAYDGEEGLAMLESGSHDVLVVDHMLPGRTGLEVIRALAERGPLPPTVMVTGAGDERTAVKAMKLGADDYLVKDAGGGHMSLLPTVIERVQEKRRLVEERRQALDALRESERQYRMLVETTGDVILLHDEEGRITFVNQAGLAFSGFTQDEVMGRSVADLLPAAERAALADRRRRRLEGDRDDYLYETAFVNRSGERVEVSVHSTPIFEGVVYRGSLIAARDITQLKQMEDRLQQQERLAALGQLASGVAHSFRNLLSTIILYAELDLRRADLPAGVAEHMRTILEESRRGADLVQQILDFSSQAMINREPVDLTELVRDLVADLRRTMPGSIGVSMTIEPQEAGDGFRVSVDAARLRQALSNLAKNAREAMPHGGELRFELSRLRLTPDETLSVMDMPSLLAAAEVGRIEGGEWIRLTVSDTGTGMTEKVRSQLFSPFFTTKDVDQGTGLGLAQVYGIVRQLGGAIDVETEPGEGTAFHLYLPALDREGEGDDPGPAATRERETVWDGREVTVLLVAGEGETRRAGGELLASLGYRALVARNRGEALALCQSPRWSARCAERVAVALVEIEAAGAEVERLARGLRKARPGLRLLAVAGDEVGEVDEGRLREAGFAGVVRGPLESEELAEALRAALDEVWDGS